MSGSRMTKGRYPFPTISGVRDTTRRVAASFNPRAVLPRGSARSSLQESLNTVEEDVSHMVEDPEEPLTLLTRLASEPPNPLANLESLLPVRQNFEDENGFITLCNDLLVLNSQEHSDPTVRSIHIPGTTGVFISPHQFYHAHHLLSQRGGRDLNGGILADEAGVGKTFVYFAASLLRALAFESQRTVRLYWSGKGRKKVGKDAEHHLAQGGNGRSCPSQRSGSIVCYCVPGSLTRTICDHTPNGVNALYVAAETWPDILNMVRTAGLSPSIYQLCLVHQNAPVRFTRPLQPLIKTLSRGAEPDLKHFSPASYIFITTLTSPRLRNVFSEATLNTGFVVIDEAHQILRTKDSLTFRMASEFSDNGANVWFVTATPFSGCNLIDWIPPMQLIAPGRAAAMRALTAALDTAKSSGHAHDAESFRAQFGAVFDRDLVVRHFGTSTFLGKSISDVQDIVPTVISRETPFEHRSAVQELANQIAYKDRQLQDPSQRGLLYLVSLFPAAAQLILESPITFDIESIRDLVRQCKSRLRIEQSQPLRRLADQIVKDSPKLDYILEELSRMGQDNRERERIDNHNTSRFGAGEDLNMKKMVIITPTVVSAVFLYLALIQHRPDVALIHNWVSAQEKEQTINNFKSLSAAKLVKHNRVLIAPFAAIGTGANLQVASYEILTSPLPEKTSQVQAFSRTNRSGQRLSPLSHKILVLEDSPVDRVVLASHATLEIESDPFNINEPLRIAGHLSLGSLGDPVGVVEEQSSSSHASTLGVDETLLLENALPFPPHPRGLEYGHDDAQESGQESGSESSYIVGGDALVLQSALSWPPGSGNDVRGQRTDSRYSLFNDLSNPSSSGPQTSDTHTPAQRPASMPTHHDLGHRPLPPLPTDITLLGGQNLGPRRDLGSLFPPLPSGPPARVDAGPTLASRRYHANFQRDNFESPPLPSGPPALVDIEPALAGRRHHANFTRDNFEIWVDDSASPAGFSPSPDNIATVDWIHRETNLTQPGRSITLGSDPPRQGSPVSPIERTPTPFREYGDDIPEPNLQHGHFDVDYLIRMARRRALLAQNDQFEEDAQDAETLEQRSQAARDRGGASRQPGQEFQDW